MPRFRVKSGNNCWYIKDHQGEEFESLSIEVCDLQCPDGKKGDCLGRIQAPWLLNPECWGFGTELFLEPLKEEAVPRIFVNLGRMLRPIDEEMV